MPTRPLFPFYGSKWNTARYYPKPVGDVCEPFAGSAGYSLFYDVERVHLLDADPIIAGLWHFLIHVKESEVRALPLLPNVGDNVDDFALPQEAKWLIGFWLNRGSASPKKSRTAFSARVDRGQLNWSERARERVAASLAAVRRWSVKNVSFSAAVNSATTFIDPPYQHAGKYYRTGFSDFSTLATWARARTGHVIVCEAQGADWLPFKPLGSFKSTKGRSAEVIWTK